MPEKNQVLQGKVEAFGTQGEGIVKVENTTFFVPFALPGEEIKFLVLKVKDNIGYGKVLEVITPSKDRVQPVCPTFGKCGGCQLQHLSYEKQLSFKREMVENTLKKVGNIQIDVPMPVCGAKQYGYRNKLQLPVGLDKDGNTVVGFYAERSHRIIETKTCAIHPEWSEKLIEAVNEYIKENNIMGYDEAKSMGSIRHVIVRDMGGKFIVAVVSRRNKLDNAKSLIEKLKKVFPEFTLIFNVHKEPTNVIFGEKFSVIYGNGTFDAEEFGITFEAGARTFVQVNEDIREKLYSAALSEVAETGDEVVVDCYSGAGLLTAMVAKRAKKAYGIEINEEASACADSLKAKNNLNNITNICGKVEEKIFAVIEKEKNEKLRLILDPPRAGIDRSVIKAINKSGIEKLVLISCNPATLARDLGLLTGTLVEDEKGALVKGDGNGAYEITKIQPYDMFAQTKHVETLVCLARKTK